MSSTPEKRLRILALWGVSHFESYFTDTFLKNEKYDIEVVSGDRSSKRSPHAASWGRLWDLRRRLERGEFDLVLSGPIQNSPWPRNKQLATRLAQAARYFTYKHRMLDTYWAPWLLGGKLRGKIPFAVTDYLDTSYVLPKDFPLLAACTLYFKVNLYFWPRRSLMPLETFMSIRRVTGFTPKLRPLSHGLALRNMPKQVRPMRERDIDLCVTGTIHPKRSEGDINPFPEYTLNPIRQEIYERCQKLKDRYKVVCVDGILSGPEYLEMLQRSKLFVCMESFGCETGRLFDVASAGAVPLVNWSYAQHYRQFQPNVHAIYFSLIGDDFERVVAEALARPDQLAEIAQAARAFMIEYKDCPKIGDYVIEETLRAHAASVRTG
jgi:hypothetical protein